jgi:hypothetical protein
MKQNALDADFADLEALGTDFIQKLMKPASESKVQAREAKDAQ